MKHRRLGGRIGFILLILALIAMIIFTVVDLRLRPMVVNAAKSKARLYASNVIAESVDAAFDSELSDGSKLINVIYGESGVSAIETDVYAVNRLRTASLGYISGRVSDIEKMTFEVPLGNLLDNSIFAGRGLPVKIRLVPIGDVSAELYSDFIETGINQSLHRIYLRVRLSMNMLTAADTVRLELSNDIILAETVIVGEVPDAYTAINRFEIDENEENDLNDYAATLP